MVVAAPPETAAGVRLAEQTGDSGEGAGAALDKWSPATCRNAAAATRPLRSGYRADSACSRWRKLMNSSCGVRELASVIEFFQEAVKHRFRDPRARPPPPRAVLRVPSPSPSRPDWIRPRRRCGLEKTDQVHGRTPASVTVRPRADRASPGRRARLPVCPRSQP